MPIEKKKTMRRDPLMAMSKSISKLVQLRSKIDKKNETILIDSRPSERILDEIYEQKLESEAIQNKNILRQKEAMQKRLAKKRGRSRGGARSFKGMNMKSFSHAGLQIKGLGVTSNVSSNLGSPTNKVDQQK